MRSLFRWMPIIALAAIGLALYGCLLIPGLAYSGYQYEKTGSLTGQRTTSASSSQTRKPVAQRTPSPNDIE